ncbi:MAG: hypothetical protein HFH36_12480 [Lachnospiraceae bacterium]|nr:hypothetical protein [Lachnospiraceae bacterium]
MLTIDGIQMVLEGDCEISFRKEILERCMFLLSVVKGTIPMNRDIGLDPDIMASPPYIAQQKYTISAIELLDEYEPRVSVEEVQFEASGGAGNIIPKVVLAYNGG